MSASAPDLAAPGPHRHRILVVDDEQDILDSLRDLLEAGLDGVEVITALSGPEGLEALGKYQFDLVVSDYKMRGMDGIDFLRHAEEFAPRVPRLMITAFPDLDLATRAINDARIVNFFTKPLDPEEVVRVLRDTLHAHEQETLRKQSFSRAMDMLRQHKGGAT